MNTSYNKNERLYLSVLFETFMTEARAKFGAGRCLTIAYALEFAARCHASVDQRRKYTFEPYIVHPVEVARIVLALPDSTIEMVISALLHDTVEDTQMDQNHPVTRREALGMIENRFGAVVREHVNDLTEVAKPSDGNRAARKALDRAHTARACGRSQTIKLADISDNAVSFMREHSSFSLMWMREKVEQALICNKADEGLHASVMRTLNQNVVELTR